MAETGEDRRYKGDQVLRRVTPGKMDILSEIYVVALRRFSVSDFYRWESF